MKKSEQMMDAIGMIDDDLLIAKNAEKRKKPSPWKKWGLALLSVCVAVTVVLKNGLEGENHVLAKAQYPQTVKFPDSQDFYDESKDIYDEEGYEQAYAAWLNAKENKPALTSDQTAGVMRFFENSLPLFLSEKENENCVYSPLNLYFALAMLSEITDGNSRQQILDALDVLDTSSLQDAIEALWLANYENDGIVSSLLANSFWLSDSLDYKQETLDILANKYFASSFSGEMGSEDYNHELQNWLDEQTYHLLQDQAKEIELDPQTVIALMSTIYFQGKWQDAFLEEETAEAVFHANSGDVNCDFMHLSKEKDYYRGDHFSAVALDIQESGKMWLILPDDKPESLFNDEQLMQLLNNESSFENMKSLLVHLSLPKFDIMSETDLFDELQNMGITDVFDSHTADFGALLDDDQDTYLSMAKHAARVSIDENGCTGAAFSVLAVEMKSLIIPEDEINFVLDRPFLFVITSQDALPLFAGVVNMPTE